MLTQKGRQAQVMAESSEVSAMDPFFGDGQHSMIIQKFAQSHRLLATVSANFRRLRQEDINEEDHRAVSLTVRPNGETEPQSIDADELRRRMTLCVAQRRSEDGRAQLVALVALTW